MHVMAKPSVLLSNDGEKIVISRTTYEDRHLMKEIGATWNSRVRAWFMPASHIAYKACVDAGLEVGAGLVSHFHMCGSPRILSFDECALNFKTKPYLHQEKWVELFMQQNQAFFLGDVGTGKTKAAIDSAWAMDASRILIVTPACVMQNFAREVKTHSDYDVVVVDGARAKKVKTLSAKLHNVYIVSYDSLASLQQDLVDFDLIIFDEIHYLKTHTSQRSKAAYDIAQKIPCRIGMTGTLIANGIQDAFGPYKVIDPSFFGTSYHLFRQRYLIMGGYDAGHGPTQIVGYKNQDEFKTIIARNSLRFALNEVTDMPEEVEIPLYVELDSQTKTIYKNIFKEIDDTEYAPTSTMDKIMKLQRVTSGKLLTHHESGEKLDVLLNHLDELQEHKVIIWCRFTDTIAHVSKELIFQNIPHVIYNGSATDKEIVAKFNASGTYEDKPYVMIAQIQMGVGWEVPSAKYAIFYEMDYSRINYVQAKGRNRRLKGSETGAVVYMYLLAKDTIDEGIYKTLQTKDFTAKEALEYVGGY